MAWEVLKAFEDPTNGIKVEKQRRNRKNHGCNVRYVFTTPSNRVFNFSRTELIDFADTVNDVCDIIEENKF